MANKVGRGGAAKQKGSFPEDFAIRSQWESVLFVSFVVAIFCGIIIGRITVKRQTVSLVRGFLFN